MMEILAPIVNFSVVVFIVIYFARKPFAQFLMSRSDAVATQIKDAEARAEKSSRELKEWESKWKLAQQESQKHLDDAKKLFARQKEDSLAAARKEAERIQKEATMLASTEAQKVAYEVQNEVVDRSVGMVSEYFSGKLETGSKEKLVSEFVELVNGSAR